MNDQDSDQIESIIPERDEVASYQRQKSTRSKSEASSSGGGAGLLARLVITMGLVVGVVACAWVYQLQLELQRADILMLQYEKRISDLEERLSDTDESVNQSGVAIQVKIKTLFSEVDKLWASAWRKNKADIAANKRLVIASASALKVQKNALATQTKNVASQADILTSVDKRVTQLDKLTAPLSQMTAKATANQRQLEKLGDQMYRLNLDFALLTKRVSTNEEWVESINGFRKQVNRNMNNLQQSVGRLQLQGQGATPTP
jgi:chromosome segregation ATPase